MPLRTIVAFLLLTSGGSLLADIVLAAPPAGVPQDLMAAVTRARYAVRTQPQSGTPAASNHRHSLLARFGEHGIELRVSGRRHADPAALSIHLAAWGREGSMRAAGKPTRTASSDRVQYEHDGLTEWWINTPRGLEQGFTAGDPGGIDRTRPLVLDLTVPRNWRTQMAGGDVALTGPARERLRYAHLMVLDARGQRIPARLRTAEGRIQIVVYDEGAAYPLTVDPWVTNEEAELLRTSSGGESEAWFGQSVAIDGDTAVVGAPRDYGLTDAFYDGGSAYVFVKGAAGWTEQQRLLPPAGPSSWFHFGSSVAISGDTLVVGSPREGLSTGGAAYVFVRNGTVWTVQAKLLADDPQSGALFGDSVGISGDTAVVGAWQDDTSAGSSAGSAYVFHRNGTDWTQQAHLFASDARSDDRFGFSVGISGDTIVAGAHLHHAGLRANDGAAYVFVRSGTAWTQQAKLTDPSGSSGFLGWSVAIDGDIVIAGAPLDDTGGSAHVFVREGSTWTHEAHLKAADHEPNDVFGGAVAIDGETTVIGAGGADAGSAYVFIRAGTWVQQASLRPPDGTATDRLGYSVAVSGDLTIVGMPLDDTAGGPDAGSAFVYGRHGTGWTPEAQLLATASNGNDRFGASVAIAGDTAVIGSSWEDTVYGWNTGMVYVFVRSGTVWTEQARLYASDAAPNDTFGESVAISEDGATLAISATQDDHMTLVDAGSVYVFVRNGSAWNQQAKLLAPNADYGDYLGATVAISGDTILAGTVYDHTAAGDHAGSAWVFVRSGSAWSPQAQLLPADGARRDFFGSVAISGDSAVVGARFDDNAGGIDAGSAYVFVRTGTTWSQHAQLFASDGAANDRFGSAVAISGETILIGASGDDTAAGVDAGSAYVFRRIGTSWSQEAHLFADDAATKNYFGTAVAVSGDAAIVGAPRSADEFPTSPGSAYLFLRSGTDWQHESHLSPSDGSPRDEFGGEVAISGDTALVGAPWHDTPAGINAGSAYVYRLTAANEADLSLIITTTASRTATGSTIIYVITVRNDGPDPAAAVVVTDDLPAGLELVSATPSQGTCSAQDPVLCNLGTLNEGASATILVQALVTAAGGTLSNAASVSSASGDGDSTDNSMTAPAVVVGPALGAAEIPTLAGWMLLMLASVLGVAALSRLR